MVAVRLPGSAVAWQQVLSNPECAIRTPVWLLSGEEPLVWELIWVPPAAPRWAGCGPAHRHLPAVDARLNTYLYLLTLTGNTSTREAQFNPHRSDRGALSGLEPAMGT